LQKYAAYLPALFIVSQVEVARGATDGAMTHAIEGLVVRVERAQGKKCERCWNYSTHVGESSEFPTLCERCVAALGEIESEGGTTAGSAGS
jgi:isoleucyl-tRNA synthetase